MEQLRKMFLSLALLLTSTIMYAQSEISGTVVDTSGEAVIGATVKEKGTSNGTITDFDGVFKLKVNEGAVLVISYIGYQTQELPAQQGMKVTLKDDSEVLAEVVVTGYQVQRKSDLTGSVGVVETKDFKASNPDPMSSLQGKVPGMTIRTTGSPSGEADVHIRGIGSMGGSSTTPLYIIDGMPYSGSLNSLNASDIETMQVLKDAASASIYGSRAANGVIVITTKKGKKGDKVNIDFNASISASWMTQKMKLLNGQQYATALVQAALNDGKNPNDYAQNYGLSLNVADGTPISVYNPATGVYDSYSVGGFYDGYMNAKKTMLYSNTDWVDEIGRTGFTQNYDLSFSKATDTGSSLFSFNYKKALGVLKHTDFENFSARFNSSYKINSIVTVGENATFSYSNSVDCAPLENALKMAPTLPVYEIDGVTFSGPVGGMSDRQNPMRELYHNKDNRLKKWRIFANAYVDITPIKGMLFRSNFGIDYTNGYIRSLHIRACLPQFCILSRFEQLPEQLFIFLISVFHDAPFLQYCQLAASHTGVGLKVFPACFMRFHTKSPSPLTSLPASIIRLRSAGRDYPAAIGKKPSDTSLTEAPPLVSAVIILICCSTRADSTVRRRVT